MEYPRETNLMRNPCHPGAVLREDVLKPLNITVTEFAKKLKISRQVLSQIINEKVGISPTMALKLAKALNTSILCSILFSSLFYTSIHLNMSIYRVIFFIIIVNNFLF